MERTMGELTAAARAVVGSALLGAGCALLAACAGVGIGGPPAPRAPAPGAPEGLRFLGAAAIPSGTRLGGTEVGGLSGIARLEGDLYAVVSDDKGDHGPARFYRVRIALGDGRLDPGGVRLEGWSLLRLEGGSPLPPGSFDLEGIAAAPDGTLYVSSEGYAEAGVAPFLARFGPDGVQRGRIGLPAGIWTGPGGSSGVRNNLSLESLTITPDGRYLFTATENALIQDGPAADFRRPSPARIFRYDLAREAWDGEYVYLVDRVRGRRPPGAFHTQGLVELVALDAGRLLALERAFVDEVGFAVRLYLVSLAAAEDVRGREGLEGAPGGDPRPAEKVLLLDFSRLGIPIDNLEGMALAPPLAGGRRPLILVSDNNFARREQTNQFLALLLPPDLSPTP